MIDGDMDMTALTMPFVEALAIAERHLIAPGQEAARMRARCLAFTDLDGSERAKRPVPATIRQIADAIGDTPAMAIRLIRAWENPKLRAAITFQPNPATLADLVLWDVVHDFFEDKCRGRSEKSA